MSDSLKQKKIQEDIFNIIKNIYNNKWNIDFIITKGMGSFKVKDFNYRDSQISFTTSLDGGIYSVLTDLSQIDWEDFLSFLIDYYRSAKIKCIIKY
jgi:hypothetical protein